MPSPANVPARPIVANAVCSVAPEALGEQGVVADLGMGVEREVVGGEPDVVLEQRPQPLREHRRQPDGQEPPEQAVMDEDEVGLQLDGALDELPLGRHARDHATHLRPAWDLEPVRPVVVERVRVEQLVERADQVVDRRHRRLARF